jgi:hypothetical protein
MFSTLKLIIHKLSEHCVVMRFIISQQIESYIIVNISENVREHKNALLKNKFYAFTDAVNAKK